MAAEDVESNFLKKPVTRREALKGALAVGAAAGLGPVMAACGGGGTSASPSATATGGPKTGGELKVGLVGGSAKDTADPQMAPFVPDDALNWLMFEGLVNWTPDYTAENVLAESVEKNADATEWTVRIKPDVMWHDGKTLTADDVVFSFQRIVDPKSPKDGAAGLGGLKPENVVKVDATTVKFRFDTPNVIFGTDALASRLVHVVPVGFDPMKPIGTGAFKMESFKPGDQFVLSAFKDYHGGAPYLDKVTLIEFQDPTARVNALLGGTIDALVELPPSQLTVLQSQSGFAPLNAKSGGWVPFTMRIDQKPFDDVRVRQAFRLIPDRTQMLQNAYSNVGWIANDMYSPFDKGYPASLPQRQQDLEQAKSLLKAAGQEGLSIELVASDAVGNGAVAAATVFAENAKAAGVNVTVNKVDSSVIYGKNYLSWTFAMDFWGLRNYLQQAAAGSTPDSPYNECHWKNDKWYALYTEALRTADDAKRNELISEAATIEYNEGGYIICSFKNQLDAYSTKLEGIVTNDVMGIPLGRWRLNKVSFK